jgi:hypothetical protein
MEHESREEFRVRGEEVGQKIKELIREGQARKIIVRKPDGELIREFALNRGLAAGALLTLIAPGLVAIGAVVALLSEVRIEVVKVKPDADSPGASAPPDPAAPEEPPGT